MASRKQTSSISLDASRNPQERNILKLAGEICRLQRRRVATTSVAGVIRDTLSEYLPKALEAEKKLHG